MNIWVIYIVFAILVCMSTFMAYNQGVEAFSGNAQVDSELWVGVSREDITPSESQMMDGFILRSGPSIGVHDNISLTALVFDDGLTRATILAVDLLGLPSTLAECIKARVGKTSGISRQKIIITASHTHSAPAMGNLRFLDPDVSYIGKVIQAAERAVSQALGNMIICRHLAVGSATVNLAINRRKDDGHGNIVLGDNPDGPVDTELSILRLIDSKEHDIVWILNYGCHPLTLGAENRLISRDYPGYVCDIVEKYRPGTYAIFINGGGGNTHPRHLGLRGFDFTCECGTLLAKAALAINDWKYYDIRADKVELKTSLCKVNLKFDKIPESNAVQCAYRAYIDRYATTLSLGIPGILERTNLAWLEDVMWLAENGLQETSVNVEIQVLTIGSLVSFLALPFEVFAETALRIKSYFPSYPLIVCAYANGVLGYLPTREEIPRGGYEVNEAHKFYGRPSSFGLDAEDTICSKSRDLILATLE